MDLPKSDPDLRVSCGSGPLRISGNKAVIGGLARDFSKLPKLEKPRNNSNGAAIVELLGRHGIKERFRADSDAVLRSIMWDGTIINTPSPGALEKLDAASSCIGLVSGDPEASAREAAAFLVSRGFAARVVPDVEPGLPIVFVVTDAFPGTVINFRKHMIHLPRPQPVPG